MGQRTLDGTDLSALREEYRRKTATELPQQARRAGDWPIDQDHCFERVVLDALFEDEWYDHVDDTPAYRHLSASQLRAAIGVADRMLDGGRPVVERLHRASLQYRRDG